MFTDADGTGPAHPDRAWLDDLDAACRWWSARPVETPTSSVLGTGAVAAAEAAVADLVGRPALLVPSATYGLRLALHLSGVGPGSSVLVDEIGWPGCAGAIGSLGGRAVPVACDRTTLTMDPRGAAAARTPATRAAIVSHGFGVIAADVPAVRAVLPNVVLIEDCAAVGLGSTLDGRPLGALADWAVFSFGPGKDVDAGEAGMLVCADVDAYRNAVAAAAHPVRAALDGLPARGGVDFDAMRPHPAAAMLVCWRLATRMPPRPETAAAAAELLAAAGILVVGRDGRRVSTLPVVVAVLDDPARPAAPGIVWAAPGAVVSPNAATAAGRVAADLLARIRICRAGPRAAAARGDRHAERGADPPVDGDRSGRAGLPDPAFPGPAHRPDTPESGLSVPTPPEVGLAVLAERTAQLW